MNIKKQGSNISIIIVCLLSIIFFFNFTNLLSVSAEEDSQTSTFSFISESNLYNQTNTYNVTSSHFSSDGNYVPVNGEYPTDASDMDTKQFTWKDEEPFS